jgi:hypothetical protein
LPAESDTTSGALTEVIENLTDAQRRKSGTWAAAAVKSPSAPGRPKGNHRPSTKTAALWEEKKKPGALGKTKPWPTAPAGEESDAQTLASLKTEPAKRKTARRRRKTSFGEKTQTAAPLAGELNQEETAAPRFREELEQGRRRISEKNANLEKTLGADTKPSNPRASK